MNNQDIVVALARLETKIDERDKGMARQLRSINLHLRKLNGQVAKNTAARNKQIIINRITRYGGIVLVAFFITMFTWLLQRQ